MIRINIPNYSDNDLAIVIDGKAYRLSISYNSEAGYWGLGIKDADDRPIISRIKLVPNFPVNRYHAYSEMPQGIFTVITNLKELGRDAFTSGRAELYYIAYSEMPTEALKYAK